MWKIKWSVKGVGCGKFVNTDERMPVGFHGSILGNKITSLLFERTKRSLDRLTIILSIVLMGDNHKILLEGLITNQGPLNGSYETHWPFNDEDAPINAERLTSSSANFLVNHSLLRCDIFFSQTRKLNEEVASYNRESLWKALDFFYLRNKRERTQDVRK